MGRLAGQRCGDRVCDVGRCVAVRQCDGQGVAADALHQGGSGAAVGCPDDQVAFAVARLASLLDGCGPLAERPLCPQRAAR